MPVPSVSNTNALQPDCTADCACSGTAATHLEGPVAYCTGICCCCCVLLAIKHLAVPLWGLALSVWVETTIADPEVVVLQLTISKACADCTKVAHKVLSSLGLQGTEQACFIGWLPRLLSVHAVNAYLDPVLEQAYFAARYRQLVLCGSIRGSSGFG